MKKSSYTRNKKDFQSGGKKSTVEPVYKKGDGTPIIIAEYR
jgi:hypothetical protein